MRVWLVLGLCLQGCAAPVAFKEINFSVVRLTAFESHEIIWGTVDLRDGAEEFKAGPLPVSLSTSDMAFRIESGQGKVDAIGYHFRGIAIGRRNFLDSLSLETLRLSTPLEAEVAFRTSSGQVLRATGPILSRGVNGHRSDPEYRRIWGEDGK